MLTFNEEMDKARMEAETAPDFPSLTPGSASVLAPDILPVNLVVHRDPNRGVLHFCVVWEAYDKSSPPVHNGYKVIELRNNPDLEAAKTNPYLFRFSFRSINSQSIAHWNWTYLGHYNADTRMGFLSAFKQWEPKKPFGNCITCVFDVLKYLADQNVLGNITDAGLQTILEDQRALDQNNRAFDKYYETNSRAPTWDGP